VIKRDQNVKKPKAKSDKLIGLLFT